MRPHARITSLFFIACSLVYVARRRVQPLNTHPYSRATLGVPKPHFICLTTWPSRTQRIQCHGSEPRRLLRSSIAAPRFPFVDSIVADSPHDRDVLERIRDEFNESWQGVGSDHL